jgi:hypothetical protein
VREEAVRVALASARGGRRPNRCRDARKHPAALLRDDAANQLAARAPLLEPEIARRAAARNAEETTHSRHSRAFTPSRLRLQ